VSNSNFLVEDTYSDSHGDADNSFVSFNIADFASVADPANPLVPVAPSGSANVSAQAQQSATSTQQSATTTLPDAAPKGEAAGDGGDDDSVPTSDPPSDDSSSDDDSRKSFHTEDGNHSDLFDNCFNVVPSNLTRYRSVGSNQNGLYGSLPTQITAPAQYTLPLAAHVDGASLLADNAQRLDFNNRAQYANWNMMHSLRSLSDIKTWLENLNKDKHLLLVHLYAAYFNVPSSGSQSFGRVKAQFWHLLSSWLQGSGRRWP
jgi:hypothetical protein